MGLKQCDNCSEMVDEAKAFCPGCGNAFVEEEKRQDTSNFEKLDNTVQLGQTMYNQMLSDMGLNISAAPDPQEKRIEVLAPVQETVAAPVQAVVMPPVREIIKPPETVSVKPKSAGNTKWIILGGLLFLILLPIAVASEIFLFFELSARFK